MKQASDSLLTLHHLCCKTMPCDRVLPRDDTRSNGYRLTPFHFHRESYAKRHRILLDLSCPPRCLFRSRLGEGRIRSLSSLPLFLIVFCTLALSVRASFSNGSLIISLKEQAVVQSDRILLKDVADLQAASPVQLQKVAQLPLGPSPAFGRVVTLSRHQIRKIIQTSIGFIPESSIRGSATVHVKLQSRSVDAGEIVPILMAHLIETTCWRESEIEIRSIENLEGIKLPLGNISLSIPSKATTTGRRNILVPIEATQAGETIRTFWITADVCIRAQVLVAEKKIPYGKVVDADNVISRIIEITDNRATYIRELDNALGKVTRRSLSPGDPLTRESLTNPYLVRNGETVKLRLERNGIVLSTLVRAEQNGKIGQVIRVRNLDFSKPLKAQVTGRAEVELKN